MQTFNKRLRGATPKGAQQPPLQHRHLLAIGVLSVFIAIAASLAPSGGVEANRAQEPGSVFTLGYDPLSEVIATPQMPAFEYPAAGPALAAADSLTPPPAAETQNKPLWSEQTVRSGDNLSLIFKRAGFSSADVYNVVNTAPEGKALSRIYPGQIIAFEAAEDGRLEAVKHIVSPLESVVYRRTDDSFSTERELRQTDLQESWVSAEITSSLFMAGQDAGLSHSLVMDLANIFGGVIDFVQDPRKGDTFNVVYEELYLDGEKYRDGTILAASFTNRGKTFNAFRYEDSNGDAGYYNEDGTSMRKAFLLAPVDFTRISSNFNMRRLHPIYKTTRPHRGTDYAAPTGTPVYAAGDGRVIKSGFTSANGNYLFVQHGEKYITRYLHLHKRKVKQGQRVSQGQIIGSVGSTGAATGPHLHYEFLVNGQHKDPRKIHRQLPKAKMLAAAEIPAFKATIANASQQLAALQSGNRLALNSEGTGTTAER
ncbi:peptidase M23 [Kineobactrum sediminis]|uniref:Peptidase M23 n=1 Tax=Kineobactrum sediminis TaxID=1905677 RepID=A0A2N5XY80_9GAMM|nr:peptidase M23 [Kineobactrum sediminis]